MGVKCIFRLGALCLLALLYFAVQFQWHASTSEEHREPIFLYRAYYDDRSGKGRFRILGVSVCLENDTQLHLEVEKKLHELSFRSVERDCPWLWAPQCKWNAHIFESPPLPFSNKIALHYYGRRVHLDVQRVKQTTNSLQVCVPPLYWYNDFPRLLLFFHLWSPYNPRFVIYVNSVSKPVRRVLEYYKYMGKVEIIPWPLLPVTANEDPNKSVYRLSHSLSHNDCVLRSSSLFTTLVDIDEFIYIRKHSLLEFAQGMLKKKPKMGSLVFPHVGLSMPFPLDETFDSLSNVTVKDYEGPPKSVFLPSRTLFLSTHAVNTYTDNYVPVKVNKNDGFLLHIRLSFGNKSEGDEVPMNGWSPGLPSVLQRETRRVFGDDVPSFTYNVSHAVTECVSLWKKEGCKTPVTSCAKRLFPLDKWIFSHPNIYSNYTLL